LPALQRRTGNSWSSGSGRATTPSAKGFVEDRLRKDRDALGAFASPAAVLDFPGLFLV
jgi:hypothetical protein